MEDFDWVDCFDTGTKVYSVEEVPGCIGCLRFGLRFLDEAFGVFEDYGVVALEATTVADCQVGSWFGVSYHGFLLGMWKLGLAHFTVLLLMSSLLVEGNSR